jgi:hypothetical protein
VDLDPGSEADRDAIRTGVGELGEAILACNGLSRHPREGADAFRRRIAHRYVRDSLKAVAFRDDDTPITVEMRALSEPTGHHHLSFDWRRLFDGNARRLRPRAREMIADALAQARDGLQAAFRSPRVLLDLDLPLPLAFLVGYEWRTTTRILWQTRSWSTTNVT